MPRFYLTTPPKSVTDVLNLLCYLCSEPAPSFEKRETNYECRICESFKDLLVYQKAGEVSRVAFRLSKAFPKEEMYSLTDQFRRAARSIGAQVAEAWGKRRYEKHFVSKLTDADAEQMETRHWVAEALDCGYLSPTDAAQLNSVLVEIGRKISTV